MTAPRGVPAGPGRRLYADCETCGGKGQRLTTFDASDRRWLGRKPCPDCGGRGVVAVDLAALRARIWAACDASISAGRSSEVGICTDAVMAALTGEGTDA